MQPCGQYNSKPLINGQEGSSLLSTRLGEARDADCSLSNTGRDHYATEAKGADEELNQTMVLKEYNKEKYGRESAPTLETLEAGAHQWGLPVQHGSQVLQAAVAAVLAGAAHLLEELLGQLPLAATFQRADEAAAGNNIGFNPLGLHVPKHLRTQRHLSFNRPQIRYRQHRVSGSEGWLLHPQVYFSQCSQSLASSIYVRH